MLSTFVFLRQLLHNSVDASHFVHCNIPPSRSGSRIQLFVSRGLFPGGGRRFARYNLDIFLPGRSREQAKEETRPASRPTRPGTDGINSSRHVSQYSGHVPRPGWATAARTALVIWQSHVHR